MMKAADLALLLLLPVLLYQANLQYQLAIMYPASTASHHIAHNESRQHISPASRQ
jgi:hypothetical protein